MSGETNLLGRLAIHYKLLTPEQLAETTLAQSRDRSPKPLGEYWIQAGLVTRAQLDRLLAVQKQVLELLDQQRAVSGRPCALIAIDPVDAAVAIILQSVKTHIMPFAGRFAKAD